MVSNGRLKTPILLRFCDTDMIGHINNVSFSAFAENGRIDMFRTYGVRGSDLILVHLGLDFKAQVQLEDDVHVETWVERVGNTSLTIRQTIFANGEPAADVKSVVVTFDYERNEPRRVPDDMREAIANIDLSVIR